MQKRLILFDIDSTLINSGGAGIAALKLASKKKIGSDEDLQGIEIAGRTDSGIVRQILAKHGIEPTEQEVRAFLDDYVELLAQQLPKCQGHVLPGIKTLLEWIESQSHLTLGLLTGNIERGAQLKLEHYELWKHFPFGAFADDHHDRNQLGAVLVAVRSNIRRGNLLQPSSISSAIPNMTSRAAKRSELAPLPWRLVPARAKNWPKVSQTFSSTTSPRPKKLSRHLAGKN